MPEFPGGINQAYQCVSKNLSIPKTDNPRITNNKVFVKFKIFEDGTIHDIFIIKNAIDCEACDIEATRVIAIMPRWKPATIKGLPVKCYYTMPIVF
jgi:protein TonB